MPEHQILISIRNRDRYSNIFLLPELSLLVQWYRRCEPCGRSPAGARRFAVRNHFVWRLGQCGYDFHCRQQWVGICYNPRFCVLGQFKWCWPSWPAPTGPRWQLVRYHLCGRSEQPGHRFSTAIISTVHADGTPFVLWFGRRRRTTRRRPSFPAFLEPLACGRMAGLGPP
jgi:hypothetical protein